jgi:hypothetical protein
MLLSLRGSVNGGGQLMVMSQAPCLAKTANFDAIRAGFAAHWRQLLKISQRAVASALARKKTGKRRRASRFFMAGVASTCQ